MSKSFICKGFFFLLMLHSTIHWSQNITGNVADNENNPLEFAAVSVLNLTDSTLISYASTNKIGKFKLTEISKGEKIFQVHLVGFKTYQKTIDFQNKSIDMGSIKLEDINILDEVIVNAEVPISIKKDTITYITKAFKIRIDDTVEDLLKKLPGVEVDATGKITAQGEDVKIIYVDKKEFFSGDPTIATKNLSADAIKKVEIIDEKSEKSRITGLNDTERKKVINLELKDENKEKGFGKFHGGYGSNDRYLTSLNYNRFSPKLQLSVIGKYNNVNSYGSDISEIMIFNNRGALVSSGSGSSNSGFLTTGVGGLNLGYELKEDKNLNTDYFYNHTDATSGDEVTKRTEFIDNQEIFSENKSSSKSISNNHSLNFSYRNRSKKLSTLYIGGMINKSRNNGNSVNSLDKFNSLNELDLQSTGTSNNESTNSLGNVSIQYIQRFNKKSKRNFSISTNINSNNDNSISNNNQLNKFNISDSTTFFESNQKIKRIQDIKSIDLGFDLNYTEPIAGNHYLELRGALDYKTTDDKVNQTRIENDIDQFPLLYKLYYNNTETKGGFFYKYDTEKFTFISGVLAIEQTFNFGVENEEEYTNKYTYFEPKINISYRPKKGKYMNINLRRFKKIPYLSQVYTIINDFNPLFVTIGNPNLTPENNYVASGMYVNHNFTTGFNFSSRINYKYTKNTIVNSQFTNDIGIRTSTYVNSGDKDSFNVNFNVGKRAKALGIRLNVLFKGSYANYFSIINNKINETNTKKGTFGFSLENNKKGKLDATLGATWSKNHTAFTSSNNNNRDYLQQSYFAKMDWNITDRLNLNNQFKYDFYTDSNFDTDQSVPIWNASISYSFLKSKQINIMFTMLDILDKNIGIERISSDNYFEESYQEVLSKYYMFSLTYNIK